MALVPGNRSAQEWLWRHQPGSQTVGSGLENGAARDQRAQGRANQSAREDPPSRRWEEEGDADGSELAQGPGRPALSQGDPMSLVKWTTHSLTHLVKALSQQGHHIKRTALADLLHEQGYSLKVNKKTMEGTSHADRDQQFGHINALCKQFEQKQAPAISVDCKKKELLGTFKNQGRAWQPKRQETRA